MTPQPASSPAAPWDAVPPSEQLFVLITGANSGIGLGIGERLIDEFLATRSLTSHLVLLPTTRSPAKSLQTVRALREHARRAAEESSALRSRAGDTYRSEDTVKRVHVISPQLDLCDVRGVCAFADRLVGGRVGNPAGLKGEYLLDVRIPRLDSVVFNAAYGGWSGVNWPRAVWAFLSRGFVEPVTWPDFKIALPTCILNDRPEYRYVCHGSSPWHQNFFTDNYSSPPSRSWEKSSRPASLATTSSPTASSRSSAAHLQINPAAALSGPAASRP